MLHTYKIAFFSPRNVFNRCLDSTNLVIWARRTAECDAPIRAVVVIGIANEDVGHSTDDALLRLVVLAGAGIPRAGCLDVDFARRVGEAEETTWDDGHDVPLVGDVGNMCPRSGGVDVVGESRVANLL
jgi:hypothetical protein